MPAINLLPKDLTPKQGVLKIADLIKKLVTIGFITLVMSLVSMIGALYLISRQLEESTTAKERLKIEISALEDTEVRLVLVKDRLQKAQSVLSVNTTKDELENFQSLISIVPEGVLVKNVVLKIDGSELSISTQSSSKLAELLARLVSSGIYKKIELTAIEFSSAAGYSVAIRLPG